MCTVTYLPLHNNNFILTSSRDETPLRETIPPKTYKENGVELTYPKDKLAGGTWIGTSTKNRLACLLNGGFDNHQRKLPYRMSRGIIVKELLSVDNVITYVNEFNFINIEPFTLIIVDWTDNLETYELVWDGISKYFRKLAQKPKIWSSSTLYSHDMKKERKAWFADWLQKNEQYAQEDILKFHNNKNLGTSETSIVMNQFFVKTVSITSVQKNENEVDFSYFDLLNEKNKN